MAYMSPTDSRGPLMSTTIDTIIESSAIIRNSNIIDSTLDNEIQYKKYIDEKLFHKKINVLNVLAEASYFKEVYGMPVLLACTTFYVNKTYRLIKWICICHSYTFLTRK